MEVTISIEEGCSGEWSICRESEALFQKLRLGPAIKLAREVARDEHQRSGRAVSVKLPGPDATTIELARYATASVAA